MIMINQNAKKKKEDQKENVYYLDCYTLKDKKK